MLITKPTSWLPSSPTIGTLLLSPCRQNVSTQMMKTQISAVAEASWTMIFWPSRNTDNGRTSTTAIYLMLETRKKRVKYKVSKGEKNIETKRGPWRCDDRMLYRTLSAICYQRRTYRKPTLGWNLHHMSCGTAESRLNPYSTLYEQVTRMCVSNTDLTGNNDARNVDALQCEIQNGLQYIMWFAPQV